MRAWALLVTTGLLLAASPVQAFSDGRVPKQFAGKSIGAHLSVEDHLKDLDPKFFTEDAIEHVYFGNWLRDYSQLIDPAMLKFLSRKALTRVVNFFAKREFGSAPEFAVTEAVLGVYRPEEHMDNPHGYDDVKAAKADRDFRGAVDSAEIEVDSTTGMKSYISQSVDFVRECLAKSIRIYPTNPHEALRLLGTALHVVEDFFSHSNYIELTLRRLGMRNVFPWVGRRALIAVGGQRIYPLVTGIFGAADFKICIGVKIKMLLSGEDSIKRQSAEHDGAEPSDFPNLQKRGLFSKMRKSISESMDEFGDAMSSVGDKIGGKMRKFKEKIKLDSPLRSVMEKIIEKMDKKLRKKLHKLDEAFFADPENTNPSHTQLSKDRFSHPLNPVSGECAMYAVKRIGQRVLQAYMQGVTADPRLLDVAAGLMAHPDLNQDHPDHVNLAKIIGKYAQKMSPQELDELKNPQAYAHDDEEMEELVASQTNE